MNRFALYITFFFAVSLSALAQSKLNTTVTNPSNFYLCIASDYLEVEVRNISTSSVSGIETKITLPAGITYISGSLSGAGIGEKNITDLTNPVFSLPNLATTQFSLIKIKLNTPCGASTFLNSGGLAIIKTITLYRGGSVSKNSNVLNIKQPSLIIPTISNQLKTADLGEKFERKISVKNSGSGKLKNLTFKRTYTAGQGLISYDGGTTTQSGYVTTSALDSSDFKTVGNGDIYLDFNETFIFTDSIEVLLCSNLAASYATSWRCDSTFCNTTQKSGNISISAKKPNLIITATSAATSCLSDTYTHDQQLVLYNQGDDTARSVDLNVFQSYGSGYYQYANSQILTSTFTYQLSENGTALSITPYSTSATVTTGAFACLGSGAKGQAFLKLSEIAPGDSIIVKWQTKSCCPTLCNTGSIYNQRWKFKATYADQCNNTINYTEQYGNVGSFQSVQISKLVPTDILDGETKTLEFTLNNGSLFYQNAKSQLKVLLMLPSALSHSLSSGDLQFTHANGSSWTPSRITQRNDTVIAYFNGVSTVTLPRSELLINILGTCSSTSSNPTQNLQLDITYNPDTTCSSGCEIPVYCTNDDIKIHCTSGCSSGLHFKAFEAKRISIGLPDNNNDGLPDASGSIDYAKIKQNRIMFGDTLLTTFRATVNNAGTINSWNFGKATTTLDYGRYLSVTDASLSIYRSGNLVVTCANVPRSLVTAGNSKTYSFDIGLSSLLSSGCLIYSAFTYRSSDSLVLNVKYVVDQNLWNNSIDLQLSNTFYLSTVQNPSSSQKYSCDDFSARLSLIGYYFTNYGRNVFTKEGCDNFNISQNFYLSIGRCCTNYAGGNIFPYEYRKWAKLQEIILQKPAGFDVYSSSFRQYRTRGTGSTASQYINTLNPDSQSPTSVNYKTDSLYTDLGGTVEISDDGFTGTYTASLTPNCDAVNGSQSFIYGFVFKRLGFLGTGLDTVFSTTTSDIVNYSRPILNITITNDFVYPEKDTIEWEVRIENTVANATANNVWTGALANSNRKIVAVKDKATNTFLPNNKDAFKIGDLAGGSYKDLIVYATYTSCSKDSLLLRLGYECSNYPDSITAHACSYKTSYLKYEPVNTRLDANIISISEDIDLCSQQEYTVQINNTGSPKVYNSYLDLELRPGMLLSDTAWLFIDGRTDSILVSNFSSLGADVYRWDFSNRDTLLDQKGINGATSSTGYKMILKFWLTTDCDFTSATSFLIRPGGYLKCGNPVNAPYLLSDPINIKGVIKPYFSAIDLHLNPLKACTYQDSTYAKFINLGPNSTGLTDRYILGLPAGILVDTTYIDDGHNAPTARPILDASSGKNIYSWRIPADITAGDSCTFKIKTFLNNTILTCGTKQIYAQAVVTSSALCVSDSLFCDINVATSSLQRADSLVKEIYDLDFVKATSTPSGSYESVSLDYVITSRGLDKLLYTELYCQVVHDANQNGTVDSGESTIATDTITSSFTYGTSSSRRFQFSVLSSLACDLLLYISDSNCVCNSTTELISNIQLLNAGGDTIICPKEGINIGFVGNPDNSYSWNNSTLLSKQDTSAPLLTAINPNTIRDTLTMILTTNKGTCSSQDTAVIIVYKGMQINMRDTVPLCKGNSTTIGSFVLGGESRIRQTSWSPSDSLIQSTGYLNEAYPITNTTYILTVTDAQGCSIQDSSLVKVVDKPNASIGLNDSCSNTIFAFKNTTDYKSTSQDSTYWDFSDLGSSLVSNPYIYIDSARTLPVKLYTENNFGCWDTTSTLLEIYPLPEASFTYAEQCEGSTSEFKATSSISGGQVTTQWVLDGNEYKQDTINYLLPNKDSLIVSILAKSNYGCLDSITQKVNVYDKPEVALNLANTCQKDSVAIRPILLSGTLDSIVTYTWDLGDNTSSTNRSFVHLYADTGTYKVELQVSTADGCTDTTDGYATIHPAPQSSFTTNDVCLGDTVWTTSTSTISKGTIATLYWDNGSGYGIGSDAQFLIPTAIGVKSVRLQVVSDKGCTDSSSVDYDVFYKEPMALHNQQGICENATLLFTSTPSQPDSVRSTKWITNNDTFSTSNFSYLYPTEGTYSLYQKIETNRGCITDSTFTVTVRPAPIARIIQSKPCNDNLVLLESSTDNQTYEWILDGGTLNANKEFNHIFGSLGKYYVSLRVYNNFGCFSDTQDSITIRAIVQPSFEIENICQEAIQWVYQTTTGNAATITSASFSMGDGNTIEVQDSFTYSYDTDGNYTVKLDITTLPGCDYTTTEDIVVYKLPTADFLVYPETPDIFTAEIEGKNNSTGGDSIRYFMSDGTIIISPDFAHKFLDSGQYEVQQWVSSAFGCLDSITKKIYISFAYNLYIPNAFTPNSDGLNESFRPIGLGLKRYEMVIYNRWGEMVFESNTDKPEWDGKDAIPGYYLYQIFAYDFRNNLHIYKGGVYLLE